MSGMDDLLLREYDKDWDIDDFGEPEISKGAVAKGEKNGKRNKRFGGDRTGRRNGSLAPIGIAHRGAPGMEGVPSAHGGDPPTR